MSVAVLALVVLGQVAADTIVVRLAPEDRELTAIEELRLGSLDGPEETSLGWIAAIAVAGGSCEPVETTYGRWSAVSTTRRMS